MKAGRNRRTRRAVLAARRATRPGAAIRCQEAPVAALGVRRRAHRRDDGHRVGAGPRTAARHRAVMPPMATSGTGTSGRTRRIDRGRRAGSPALVVVGKCCPPRRSPHRRRSRVAPGSGRGSTRPGSCRDAGAPGPRGRGDRPGPRAGRPPQASARSARSFTMKQRAASRHVAEPLPASGRARRAAWSSRGAATRRQRRRGPRPASAGSSRPRGDGPVEDRRRAGRATARGDAPYRGLLEPGAAWTRPPRTPGRPAASGDRGSWSSPPRPRSRRAPGACGRSPRRDRWPCTMILAMSES